jgi:hypothetical protein
MIKNTTAAADWVIYDNARDPNNPRETVLYPNLENSDSSGVQLNFTSTGFEFIKGGANANSTGNTYIYAAFAGTTTRFDADDANDVAAFNAVKTKLESFPTNKETFRQLIISKLAASSLTTEEQSFLLGDNS